MVENSIKNFSGKKSNVRPIKLLIIDRKIVKKIKNPTISKIIEFLESHMSVEVFWLLVDPELQNNNKNSIDFNYKDFEDYKTTNTLEILKQEKPDLIIISNDYDFKIRSFIPSAKKLEIPIILLIQTVFFDHYLDKMNSEMMQERIKMVNQNIKTYMFNYFSMLKNYFQIHYNLVDIFKMIIHDFFAFFNPGYLWGRYDCDLILVPSKSWKTMLEKKNIQIIQCNTKKEIKLDMDKVEIPLPLTKSRGLKISRKKYLAIKNIIELVPIQNYLQSQKNPYYCWILTLSTFLNC